MLSEPWAVEKTIMRANLFNRYGNKKRKNGKPVLTQKEKDILGAVVNYSMGNMVVKYKIPLHEIEKISDVATNKLRQYKLQVGYTNAELSNVNDPWAIAKKISEGTFEEDGEDAVQIAYHPTYGWK